MSPPDARDTLGRHLATLLPDVAQRRDVLDWPPDVFALTASALGVSGAYVRCFASWSHDDWNTRPRALQQLGKAWRAAFNDGQACPPEIADAWTVMIGWLDEPIESISENEGLRAALFKLFAAADEACEGIGYNPAGRTSDPYHSYCAGLLGRGHGDDATLCEAVIPSTARVLPKMHTPQRGLTLRSLSRNLALCPTASIRAAWKYFVEPVGRVANATSSRAQPRNCNVLLIPWPFEIAPRQFKPCEQAPKGPPGQYGEHQYFQYEIPNRPKRAASRVSRIERIIRSAHAHDCVDIVVLPELALLSEEFAKLTEVTKEIGAMLVAGVGIPSERVSGGGRVAPPRNEVRVDFPFQTISHDREKHHRWCLDRSQILQYGLGGNLHTQANWWEWIKIADRRIDFFAVAPRFTMCALVCEDLAQQDPLSQVLRAIGPNLVISILMDGPQLAARWPGRYAGVLADDPGSSVLTLTSIGMTELCRPRGEKARRCIALWKDGTRDGTTMEIELPPDASAACLHLTLELRDESTADGRSGDACYPVLGGVHFIKEGHGPADRAGYGRGAKKAEARHA